MLALLSLNVLERIATALDVDVRDLIASNRQGGQGDAQV
jgi:hypothetical protein